MTIGEVKSGDFGVQLQKVKPLELKTTMVKQRKVFVSTDKLVKIASISRGGLGRTEEEKDFSRLGERNGLICLLFTSQ